MNNDDKVTPGETESMTDNVIKITPISQYGYRRYHQVHSNDHGLVKFRNMWSGWVNSPGHSCKYMPLCRIVQLIIVYLKHVLL